MARSVNFEGIGFTNLVYFKSALVRGTDENKLVKLSADETVALAGNGEQFIGIVRVIDPFDAMAGVQIDGIVEDYPAVTGEVPALGFSHICAHTGSATVETKSGTLLYKLYRVLKSDDTADVCTFIL